jgi:hypothetical protein
VQCVLNFADNVEEDGGTVIVPQFHKHIRPWCAENISLRKNVPFLTFNKPTIASKAVDKGGSAVDIQPQSPGEGKSQEITGVEAIEPFAGRINASKNLKVKRRQKSCMSARAAPVDHEAPLLALAQRIPMRQVRSQSALLSNILFFNLRQDHGLFAQLNENLLIVRDQCSSGTRLCSTAAHPTPPLIVVWRSFSRLSHGAHHSPPQQRLRSAI